MPLVPEISPGVSEQVRGASAEQPRISVEDLTRESRALAQLGGVVQQTAQYAATLLGRKRVAEAKEAVIKYEAGIENLLIGYQNIEGMNAKDLPQTYEGDERKLRDSLTASMSGEQRKVFDEHALPTMLSGQNRATRHATTQVIKAEDDADIAAIQLAQINAAKAPDPTDRARYLTKMEAGISERAKRHGWDKAQTLVEYTNAAREVWGAQVDMAITDRNWKAAASNLAQGAPWLDPKQVSTAQRQIFAGQRVDRIASSADAVWSMHKSDQPAAIEAARAMDPEIRSDVERIILDRFEIQERQDKEVLRQDTATRLQQIMFAGTYEEAAGIALSSPDPMVADDLMGKAKEYHAVAKTSPTPTVRTAAQTERAIYDIGSGAYDGPDGEQRIVGDALAAGLIPSQVSSVMHTYYERKAAQEEGRLVIDPTTIMGSIKSLSNGDLPRSFESPNMQAMVVNHLQAKAKERDWKSMSEAEQYMTQVLAKGSGGTLLEAMLNDTADTWTPDEWRPDIYRDVRARFDGMTPPSAKVLERELRMRTLDDVIMPDYLALLRRAPNLVAQLEAGIRQQTGLTPSPWEIVQYLNDERQKMAIPQSVLDAQGQRAQEVSEQEAPAQQQQTLNSMQRIVEQATAGSGDVGGSFTPPDVNQETLEYLRQKRDENAGLRSIYTPQTEYYW